MLSLIPSPVNSQLVFDAATHEHDLRHALGEPGARDDLVATLVAGSPLRTIGGIVGRGAATVFLFNGTSWVTFDRLTLPVGGSSASNFGRSAACTAEGTVLIGAPKHDGKGTVREFLSPSPT